MDDWKIFELECVDYLNKQYGGGFKHLGYSDSTVSDIEYKSGLNSFYIEVKMPVAQSGQFVLLVDQENREFVFSSRNKTKRDESVDFIIEHMNENFEK